MFRFDHQAFLVTDVDDAVAWFAQVFGTVEVYDGTEKEHIRWVTFGDGQALHLIESVSATPEVPKPVHLALRTEDLPGFINRLDELSIAYEDWPGTPGRVSVRPDQVQQVYVVAPGGYYVEVNSADGVDRRL